MFEHDQQAIPQQEIHNQRQDFEFEQLEESAGTSSTSKLLQYDYILRWINKYSRWKLRSKN